MTELECQQLIIDAARKVRGNGIKCNNRFLVGVVDLMIKLPGAPAFWLEVKLHKLSPRVIERGHSIADIGCTPKQKQFLREWHEAGMPTGVASFVQADRQDIRSLRMAVYSYEDMLKQQWSGHTATHVPLGGHLERMDNVVKALMRFTNGQT